MRRFVPVCLVILLLGALAMPLARAQGDDDDFEEVPRIVELEVGENEFRSRSSGPKGDRIEVRFVADSAELRLEFVPPGEVAVRIRLQLTPESLLEFEDADGDGRFGLRDPVVQTFEINDLAPNPIRVEAEGDGHRIAVNYTGEGSTLVLGLVFRVVRNATLVEGVRIVPTEVKFDVEIKDFPFVRADSLLALQLELETEAEPRLNFTGGQGELRVLAERYAGFFRWAENATADGIQVPVRSTIVQAETEVEEDEFESERTVALTYPRAQEIRHDPSVGVLLVGIPGDGVGPVDLPPGFSGVAYGLTLVLAAVFVMATLWVQRRWRKRDT